MNENAIKKTIPSEKEAEELLEEVEKLNPGSWTAHCKTAGLCARKIAERCRGLDEDKAYVMGLLRNFVHFRRYPQSAYVQYASFVCLENGQNSYGRGQRVRRS